jgi:hypothetical protein
LWDQDKDAYIRRYEKANKPLSSYELDIKEYLNKEVGGLWVAVVCTQHVPGSCLESGSSALLCWFVHTHTLHLGGQMWCTVFTAHALAGGALSTV